MLRSILRWSTGLAICYALAGCDNDPNVPDVTLTVVIDPAGTGTGKVSADPSGILCPTVCSDDEIDQGTKVTLGAFPDPGSDFTGWTGDCSGAGYYDLTMDADHSCTARFDIAPAALLTIDFDPAGTGTGKVTGPGIDCGSDCSQVYPINALAGLTVTPDPNSTFGGWGGDCAGLGTDLGPVLTMDASLDCTVRFDLISSGGVLTGRGSIAFDHRIEASVLRAPLIWTAGFDLAQGNTIDISNPDNLVSGVGAEFGSCLGARGLTYFFSPLPQYLQDVMHATCTSGRDGSLTPSGGGFTQLENYAYEPGEAEIIPGTQVEAVVDFEFGQLRLVDRDDMPGTDVLIPLSNPLERSCPFDITIQGSIGYVVGREGVAGTSTENCENWHGLWRVDLALNQVIGFTEFGTKLRDAVYFNGNVYVTDFEEDKVHIVNGTTGAYDHFIAVGDGPTSLVIEDRASDPDRMYVTNWNINGVAVYDLSTEQEVDYAPSGGVAPVKVFLSGTTLIVVNFGDIANDIDAVIKAFSVQ